MAESTMPEQQAVVDEIRSNKKIRRCHPFIRFAHIFFSIILTLYGAGILLLTITGRIELNEYLEYLHYYLETPILILLLGSKVLIGIGSLGFISSACFIYQGIVTFGVFVFGLLMFKLSIGILVLVTLNSAEKSVKEALELSIDNYTTNNVSIECVQTNLYCCGVVGYTDWSSTLGYIPGSCCGSGTTCEPSDVIERSSTGCYEALIAMIDSYIYICILILGVLVALEIGAIIVTVLLVRDVKRNERRVSSYEENSSREDIEEPKVRRVTKNPMAARSNLREDDQLTNTVHPLPDRKLSETKVRLPTRRLASFNYPIHSHRVVPTAPPMPGMAQKHAEYPRIF